MIKNDKKPVSYVNSESYNSPLNRKINNIMPNFFVKEKLKIIEDLSSNDENREEIKELIASIESFIERKSSRDSKIRWENNLYRRQLELLTNESKQLKNKLKFMDQQTKIFIPIPNKKDEKAKLEFEYLGKLITEINKSYENSCYTAVALLCRKLIVNLSQTLSKKDGKDTVGIEYIIESKNMMTGEILNIKKVTPVKIKDITYQMYIVWLYKNRYLTNKGQEHLEQMRVVSNDLNHQINISETKLDARKYFLTTKELVESNFDSNNIVFKIQSVEEE